MTHLRNGVFCALLMAQNVLQIVLTRYSLIQEGTMYLATSATLADDVIKMVLCFLVVFIFLEKCSIRGLKRRLRTEILDDPRGFMKLAIPALLYVIQDNLMFLALANMDGAEFQTMFQLKVIATAVLSSLVLGRKLTALQWISQIAIFFGVGLVKWDGPETLTKLRSKDQLVGIMAVLGCCLTSSIAGCYFEKFFKGDGPPEITGSSSNPKKRENETFIKDEDTLTLFDNGNFDIDESDSDRNNESFDLSLDLPTHTTTTNKPPVSMWVSELSLAIWSIPFGLLGIYVKDRDLVNEGGVFQGFSPLVWCVIFVTAFGGFLSLIVVLYLDNICKNLTYSLSFIPVSIFSVFLFGFEPQPTFYIGAGIVMLSGFCYVFPLDRFLLDLLGCCFSKGKNQLSKVVPQIRYERVNNNDYDIDGGVLESEDDERGNTFIPKIPSGAGFSFRNKKDNTKVLQACSDEDLLFSQERKRSKETDKMDIKLSSSFEIEKKGLTGEPIAACVIDSDDSEDNLSNSGHI